MDFGIKNAQMSIMVRTEVSAVGVSQAFSNSASVIQSVRLSFLPTRSEHGSKSMPMRSMSGSSGIWFATQVFSFCSAGVGVCAKTELLHKKTQIKIKKQV